ncbi:MAG TPA: hypothetical protein VL307_14060, partial [Chitinophagaceae bacterium]|nr:hypothetical protein [Chitinophagaceae bacterium]
MRRIFYLSLFLFSYAMVSAQQPGGVPGSVLWLRGDGYTLGATATWTDFSGLTNNFTNSDPGRSPSPNANIYNFNSALTFDGSVFLSNALPTSFPEADNPRTIFVVANPANASPTSGFQWILAYGTRSPLQSVQVGASNTDFSNAFYFLEFNNANYWAAGSNPTGGLMTFVLENGFGSQYDRGNYSQSQSLSGLGATSIDAVIGALDTNPTEAWNGNIGEVIIYPSALSDADRGLVESYLALKYGFSLGTNGTPLNYTASDGTTVFWTGSTTFQNDIFGIGTDNGSQLVVSLSNSMNTGSGDGTGQSGKANITIGVATDPLDKQFLMIGNDGGSLAEQTIAAGQAPVIAVGSSRLGRNWKVQNTGAVGPLDLFTIDLVGLTVSGGSDPDNYRLMIDNDGDGDYSTGTPD